MESDRELDGAGGIRHPGPGGGFHRRHAARPGRRASAGLLAPTSERAPLHARPWDDFTNHPRQIAIFATV